MPKRLLICLILLFPQFAAAQRYVLDHNLADSACVYEIIVAKDGSEVCGTEAFKLPMGKTVKIERTLSGSEHYGLTRIDGKPYAVDAGNLLFSDDNPEGVEDIFGDTRDRVQHSWVGKWFGTYTPFAIIALLFAVAMVFAFGGLRIDAMRGAALRIIPICILGASLFEIWAYSILGKDVFWWCDSDTFGFFGSLLRAIPFMIFVAFQILSVKFYETLLLGHDSDIKLSVKPMAIGMGIAIPVVVALGFLLPVFGIRGTPNNIICAVALLGCVFVGFFWSLRNNVRSLGKICGTLFTVFSVVYVIGSLIAVWGLLVLLFKMILQILIVGSVIGMLSGKYAPTIQSSSNQEPYLPYKGLDGRRYASSDAKYLADVYYSKRMGAIK